MNTSSQWCHRWTLMNGYSGTDPSFSECALQGMRSLEMFKGWLNVCRGRVLFRLLLKTVFVFLFGQSSKGLEGNIYFNMVKIDILSTREVSKRWPVWNFFHGNDIQIHLFTITTPLPLEVFWSRGMFDPVIVILNTLLSASTFLTFFLKKYSKERKKHRIMNGRNCI